MGEGVMSSPKHKSGSSKVSILHSMSLPLTVSVGARRKKAKTEFFAIEEEHFETPRNQKSRVRRTQSLNDAYQEPRLNPVAHTHFRNCVQNGEHSPVSKVLYHEMMKHDKAVGKAFENHFNSIEAQGLVYEAEFTGQRLEFTLVLARLPKSPRPRLLVEETFSSCVHYDRIRPTDELLAINHLLLIPVDIEAFPALISKLQKMPRPLLLTFAKTNGRDRAYNKQVHRRRSLQTKMKTAPPSLAAPPPPLPLHQERREPQSEQNIKENTRTQSQPKEASKDELLSRPYSAFTEEQSSKNPESVPEPEVHPAGREQEEEENVVPKEWSQIWEERPFVMTTPPPPLARRYAQEEKAENRKPVLLPTIELTSESGPTDLVQSRKSIETDDRPSSLQIHRSLTQNPHSSPAKTIDLPRDDEHDEQLVLEVRIHNPDHAALTEDALRDESMPTPIAAGRSPPILSISHVKDDPRFQKSKDPTTCDACGTFTNANCTSTSVNPDEDDDEDNCTNCSCVPELTHSYSDSEQQKHTDTCYNHDGLAVS